ncbi:hypothetical protein F4818DRAFT_409453 [Hypoxylon cercidicola]|nr:hypothetical protein F4818DRAFT_409453 [Hypoxylon cercidicola]
MATSPSYLIVSAGCFGASTARALKKTYPNADVLVLDPAPFPNPTAAAHDFNKIIRAEYDDPSYMALALEAKEISVPPLSRVERMTWTTGLPDALTAISASVRDMLFGDSVQGMKSESYRLCWYVLAWPSFIFLVAPFIVRGFESGRQHFSM